jgi:fatty acid desaturase
MKQSPLLPPAVLGDKKLLSPQARAEIDSLNGRRPGKFLFQLAYAWFVIFAAIGCAIAAQNVLVSILAILIIATRQHILLLLIHEQCHCLGFKSKYGDLFVDFFVAYALFVITVEGYSQVHLTHHRYFFSSKDADILRKSGDNWTFPMPRQKLAKLFLSDLLAFNVWKMIKGKMAKGDYTLFKRPSKIPRWIRPAYYILLSIILTLTHSWGVFLLYWIVPLMTIFQVIVRWGALCEHQYVANAGVIDTTPIIIPKWWENLVLPNLNFNMHTYHHFFPGIAFCELPKVHAIFEQEKLIDDSAIFKGYFSYLKYLVRQ